MKHAGQSCQVTWQIGNERKISQVKESGVCLLDVFRQQMAREFAAGELKTPLHGPAGITAPCGGNGTCGKCRVQILQGEMPATEADMAHLSPEEVDAGYRLACRAVVAQDLTVRIPQEGSRQVAAPSLGLYAQSYTSHGEGEPLSETAVAVPEGGEPLSGAAVAALKGGEPLSGAAVAALKGGEPLSGAAIATPEGGAYALAVDLGTTTLAAALIDRHGIVLSQATAMNTQRIYGADVASRIQASIEGKQEELRACICADLKQLFQKLLAAPGAKLANGTIARVSRIAIAGNTTMLHLLRGYSCETLGRAPFTPVCLDCECLTYEEVFGQPATGPVPGNMRDGTQVVFEPGQSPTGPVPGDACIERECLVYLLPGLSAFVGADIAAGIYSSGFWQTPEDEIAVFLDLGTNGEMAAGNGTVFFTASTAAGPVFEGGGLSCGMPGLPGAIFDVSYLYHRVRIQTIAQKKPQGICGTGALAAVAALLKEGLLDAEGLLAPGLFETGMVLAESEDGGIIRLTQADIRNIQVAKAAICAGVEALVRRFREETGLQHLPIGRVCLAGGFGYYLSKETAATVGLLPKEWKGQVAACGNTSLKGAVDYLVQDGCAAQLKKLPEKNREVVLAQDAYFQELYIQRMRFM